MTNKEKEYIKELGDVYVKTGVYSLSCGGGSAPEYKKIDIIKYLDERDYTEKLDTYMKYRNTQRYTKEWACGGGSYMRRDNLGEYIMKENGAYLNIVDFESKLKPEDIKKEILKDKKEQYKNNIRFTKVRTSDGNTAYLQDVNGVYIYDQEKCEFIDISK